MPLHELRRTMLRESPANPRKTFDQAKLEELAENIRQHGVLEPLLARPLNLDIWHSMGLDGLEGAGEPLEVVAGARRLRASELAGLERVPVIVRVLSDEAAEIIMLSENLHRNDLSPLEEADAFVRLVHLHHVDIADVAAKAGRSRQYVAQRLRLATLPEAARAALASGQLSIGVASTLAALPASALEPATQKALELVANRWTTDEIIRELRGTWTLKLASAPWPLDDASLGAVACSACPTRSNAQLSLLAEGAELDTCLDRVCFGAKRTAWWERRASLAKSAGVKVVKTEEVFKHGYIDGRKYTRLDETCWEDPKRRTYAALLEDTQAPRILVQKPDGAPLEVIATADAARALKEAGHTFAKSSGPREKTAVEKRAELTARIETETDKRMLTAVLNAAGGEKPATYTLAFWRALAKGLVAMAWHETVSTVARRRGVVPDEDPKPKGKKASPPRSVDYQRLLTRAVDGYEIRDCRGLAVEILCERGLTIGDDDSALEVFGKVFGVGRAAIEARVRAELTKPSEKPSAKAAARAASKTTTKPTAKASAKPARKGGAK